MRDISEYEDMLSGFKYRGLQIVKTEMQYQDRVVGFWVIVPSGCENLASEFRTSVMSFYPDFEVVVKCKEEG